MAGSAVGAGVVFVYVGSAMLGTTIEAGEDLVYRSLDEDLDLGFLKQAVDGLGTPGTACIFAGDLNAWYWPLGLIRTELASK